jgi:hypothetical protein
MYYAQLTNGIVTSVTETAEKLPESPDLIMIDSYDVSLLGSTYDGLNFHPPMTVISLEAQIESDFNSFLKEKNIDSIGEASALLNSTNPIWKSEAQRAIELWDLTWQAFYNNEPLPELAWL